MNKLVFESDGKQHEIALSSRPVSLGRSDEADYQLPTKMASRIHAQVFPRERGWWVEDLGSSNGTVVNGNKIGKPMPLVPGDVITLGDINLKFEGAAAAPAGPPDHLVARILYTPEKGQAPVETLIRDRVTIGRKPDNSLSIDSKVVSGSHLEIVNRQGAYIMRDLGSSNGTYIEKQRVSEHTLRNGDVMLLGKKIPVYFVDPAAKAEPASPAAQAPQPAPSMPPPMPKKPKVSSSSAASASDRGSFEPIPEAVGAKKSVNPLPHIAVGLGLGALFLLAGWLLGTVIEGLRSRSGDQPNTREPEPALADKPMSFEGEIDDLGNPEGWTASFESAGGATAELYADRDDPFDGERSLSISARNASGASTLVLQTTQARKLDLGGAFQLAIAMKGEGASKIAVALSMIDEKGSVVTLAAGSFVGIRGTEWAQFTMSGTTLTPPPESAQLRLMVAGGFSRLWIDRVELTRTADDRATVPFGGLDSPNLIAGFNPDKPALVDVAGVSGRGSARFQPKLLDYSNRHLSEDDLWAVSKVSNDSVTYAAMLAAQGDAGAVKFQIDSYDNGYFTDHGLRLDWMLAQGGGATLAVEITLPLPSGATVTVVDRRGYYLDLNQQAVHAYAYSTVSEFMVDESGISVSFPRGAVVWFDLSRPGAVVATVRAAQESNRKGVTVDVNSRPLMFARLYQRLYGEAQRMMDAKYYSAARERFLYLTSDARRDRDLPVINRARERLTEIADHLTEVKERLETSWESARTNRNRPSLLEVKEVLLQYIAEFPGEGDIGEMGERLASIEIWLAELVAEQRTPAEMAEAEAIARSLLDAAEGSNGNGNVLLALVMLENIMKNYSDTSQYRNAQALHEKIMTKLADPAEQNRVIDEELKGIDEDIKFADWERGRNRCLALFKRFPNTKRNRDIMKRLRIIESAFED
ncbi:MAG: FHA domain-containing protein [Planctomycetes bacterium]|nr:FHA domain-containing protein [Planctomycetota bacterium]